MKRAISIALLLVLCLGLFAGCTEETSYDLEGAKKYLEAMYMSSPDTPLDYTLVGFVTVNDVRYTVDWTSDVADVVIVRGEDNKVTVDVPEAGEEALKYVLTATITAPDGTTITTKLNRRVPVSASAGKEQAEIVEAAYALADGEVMENVTLTGKIVKLVAPINPQFNSMRFTIAVDGCEDKPILCYNITGDLVSNDLCVGDTATVTGNIKNYQGTIEFDTDCVLTNLVPGGATKPTDSKVLVDQAFDLEPGTSMPYFVTLTGKIAEINDAYSSQYGNITVTIGVEGSNGLKALKCYRMKGTGADAIAVGDTITVTGLIKNYQHSSGDCEVEFDAGCSLDSYVKGDGKAPEIPEEEPADKPSTDNTDKPSTSNGKYMNITVDTLGVTSQSYTSDTAIVSGVNVEWIQLGNYGNGIQMRDKDGNTSMLWNTSATPSKIVKIEFTFNSAKTVYGGNNMIVNFGNKAKGADCAMTLTTVADKTTYTITPNGDYKYFYIEWDTGYSAYWDSIKVYCDGISSNATNKPATPSESTQPSTPSTPSTPSQPGGETVSVANGNYVIYVPAYNMALSSEYTGYYNKGVAVSGSADALTGYGTTEIWTITNNSDGTISISVNGQKLAMGAQFSSMPLGEVNDKWVLEDAGNGLVYIKNVGRDIYIEWYADKNNWSGYGTIGSGKEGMFAIKLVKV